jgi:hypothetical protein
MTKNEIHQKCDQNETQPGPQKHTIIDQSDRIMANPPDGSYELEATSMISLRRFSVLRATLPRVCSLERNFQRLSTWTTARDTDLRMGHFLA